MKHTLYHTQNTCEILIHIDKKVIISTKSFFYSKGTEGRELKLVSSLSAFVYLNIVRGSVNKKKKTELIEIVEFATINLYIEDKK